MNIVTDEKLKELGLSELSEKHDIKSYKKFDVDGNLLFAMERVESEKDEQPVMNGKKVIKKGSYYGEWKDTTLVEQYKIIRKKKEAEEKKKNEKALKRLIDKLREEGYEYNSKDSDND